jgi:hypothetical protein
MELKRMIFTKKNIFEYLTPEQIKLAGAENISRWIDEVAEKISETEYRYDYLKFPTATDEESFMAWLFYPVDVARDEKTKMIENSHFPEKIEVEGLRDPKETLARLSLACTLKNHFACKAMQKFFKAEAKSYEKKVKLRRTFK